MAQYPVVSYTFVPANEDIDDLAVGTDPWDGGLSMLDIDEVTLAKQDIRRSLGVGTWLTAMPHRYSQARVSFTR